MSANPKLSAATSAESAKLQPHSTAIGEHGSITVERELTGSAFSQSLTEVQTQCGKPLMSQVHEIAALAFSRGRITPAEYFDLRLFDDSLPWERKLEFAGLRAAQRCWKICNYDPGWRGLVWDKTAIHALLEGYGFPVPETLAVLHESRTYKSIETLRTADDMCRFLVSCESYPLFCKPNSSLQSLGSLALSQVDRNSMLLQIAGGGEIMASEFARMISRYADKGYLVQRQLRPHPALTKTVGDAVSTVRVLTINGPQGPRIIRALWKIPGAGNFADNFWRDGNMLGSLDYETGRVLRLVAGTGTSQRVLGELPGSATRASDLAVPAWKDVLELSKAAADALPRLRLIGWDIAPTDNGPVIIEANDTPDFGLPQHAEQRGMLDSEFVAFMRECQDQNKHEIAEASRLLKESKRKSASQLRRQTTLIPTRASKRDLNQPSSMDSL